MGEHDDGTRGTRRGPRNLHRGRRNRRQEAKDVAGDVGLQAAVEGAVWWLPRLLSVIFRGLAS